MARTTNNNTNTIAQTNNNTSIPNLFTAYLDSDKIASETAEDTRRAIKNSILTNTSIIRRVTVDEKAYLDEKAERFICATRIYFYMDGHCKKQFSFINNMQEVLKEIQRLYTDVVIAHGAAYEDEDSVTINDIRHEGFCWKSTTNGVHCGLYCVTEEEVNEQLDCSDVKWDE